MFFSHIHSIQANMPASKRPTVSTYNFSIKLTSNSATKSSWRKVLFFLLQQLHFKGCNNLEINGITSFDSPRNHISIRDCRQVKITQIKLIAPGDSPNTDGIDISTSTDVEIYDTIVGTGTQLDISPFGITKFPISNGIIWFFVFQYVKTLQEMIVQL